MSGSQFLCRECGGKVFIVVHRYRVLTHDLQMLPCRCGCALDALAAQRTEISAEEVWEWGPLREDHGWDYLACNLEELGKSREAETVFCQRCAEDVSSDALWVSLDRYDDSGSHEFYVFCELCEREIEFGWTEENGPRIWPEESADFDPARCRPDVRHLDSWKVKGWI